MKPRNLGALGVVALFVVSACSGGGATTKPSTTASSGPSATAATSATPPASTGTKGTVKIGVDLPLSGGEIANGEPTKNGVLLAIDEANAAGTAGGYTLDSNVQDDAQAGVHNPTQGASNAQTLTADDAVVGMVGPFNSNVARAIIPVTNEAGLAECSPSNTAVDLTKEGSEKLRKSDVRNYFRVATPDDIQGPANAQWAFKDLGKKAAYVMDDTEAFGVGVADSFTKEFESLGGKVVKRDGNDFTKNQDFTGYLTAAKALNPDVLFFGGTQSDGGGQLRKQMGQLGMLAIPFVGPDGTTDLGTGGSEGAFITLAGVDNSDNVSGTIAGIHDIPNPTAFSDKYKAKFSKEPGAYSALAYACTQILIQAIGKANASDMAGLRKAVRDYVFSGAKFDTVLGPLSLDANGDSSQKFISFYKTDVKAEGGKGGWVFVKQQDFAVPAP